MIVPLLRMTALALSDATLGVNAQIDALALDTSLVTAQSDSRPPHVSAVKNQADHNVEVREADDESQFPLIVVCAGTDFVGPGQVWSGVQDGEGTVTCAYVTRSGYDATAFTETDYTLRAMKKALHQYLLSSGTRDTNGKRNSVAIKSAKRISYGHAKGSLMGGAVAGVLTITFDIRDLTP